MTIDARKIEKSIKRVTVELEGEILKDMRRLAIAADAQLVANTPRDTGRAAANWLPALNVPRRDEVGKAGDEFPNPLAKAASEIVGVKIGDSIFLSNNLPYILRLNDGHSKKAPSGFVEAAIRVAINSLGL